MLSHFPCQKESTKLVYFYSLSNCVVWVWSLMEANLIPIPFRKSEKKKDPQKTLNKQPEPDFNVFVSFIFVICRFFFFYLVLYRERKTNAAYNLTDCQFWFANGNFQLSSSFFDIIEYEGHEHGISDWQNHIFMNRMIDKSKEKNEKRNHI